MIELDAVQTLAFAGVVLFAGYALRRRVAIFARYNLPAPVLGGLLVALAVLAARAFEVTLFEPDTATQSPLMIAFFTTIGFGASLRLLRVGGPQVVIFLLISSIFAVLQNALGVLLTLPFGLHPLFGVLAGSVTLTGGPATGLAFAPLFEQAGVPGAATVAVAAAMFGIVVGGIVGGPIGTRLIERGKLRTSLDERKASTAPLVAAHVVEAHLPESPAVAPAGEDEESYGLLKALCAILVAMWAGGWVSKGFAALGVTLPAYIGAMLIASVLRNLDDKTRLFAFSQRTIDDIGNVALSLFLALALMTLKLWQLAGLALPLCVLLIGQVGLIVIASPLLFRLMGKDYEAAVMASGFCGFMLGTTANAMANMKALSERYGPSPRAFLVVPMVGAFFIDFINALIVTACLNVFGSG